MICIPTNGNRLGLGRIIVTPAAARAMKDAKEMPAMFLAQHLEDKFPEGETVSDGRLMSAYLTSNGVILWIITEPDRSATTILLPEDS